MKMHRVNWGIKPPQKRPPLFSPRPFLKLQVVQAPFLGNFPLYSGF